MKITDLPSRFTGRVLEVGECWEWQGYRNPAGYGQIRVDNVAWLAHRYSYSVCVGDIPEGLCLLHDCDNPACVRPSHLCPGTNYDNQQDRIDKGKGNNGERNGMSKLSYQDVIDIRRRVESGEKAIRLAEEFGVNRSCISKIVNKIHWSD